MIMTMPQCFIIILNTHLVSQSQYIIDLNVVKIYSSSNFFFSKGGTETKYPPPPLDTALVKIQHP